MTRERVVVAMSGGVDSSVAAARAVAAGYDVIGVSLRLLRDGSGTCCSLDDFHEAAAVADRLGFPHYVFDAADVFARHVVEPFVAAYVAGRTPNPCARCNQHLKFGLLLERARELGARCLVTGHYARLGTDPATGRPVLRAARDRAKDQTYFLFMLGPAELDAVLFPVGELTKSEVRAAAAALGLAVADKPDSMEVCFVAGGDVAGFVERTAGEAALRPGPIVDVAGRPLGRHAGVHRFTVGQRRGLGLAGGPRRYVRAIDAASGTVVVTETDRPRSRGLLAREVGWATGVAPPVGTSLGVRIRHRHPALPAHLAAAGDGVAEVVFLTPGPAVTPGQAAVFYQGELVLGGGWIAGELA